MGNRTCSFAATSYWAALIVAGYVVLLGMTMMLFGCSAAADDNPLAVPPVPPRPSQAGVVAPPPADPTTVRNSYLQSARKEGAAVIAAPDANYVRRLHAADAEARHALSVLESPHAGASAIAQARAAVGALQDVLGEAP